jgi:hypothetical protein
VADQHENQHQNDEPKPLTDRELEIVKIYLDAFKHITTFCSGAIVVTATVVGVLFPKPHYSFLLAFSIGLLLVGAAAGMFGLSSIIPYLAPSNQDESARRARPLFQPLEVWERLGKALLPALGSPFAFLWISVLSAYIGIACFAFFALFNLAPAS